jgi:hypothetical protein
MKLGNTHASINYEDGLNEVIGSNNGKSIGIDVGVKVFAYTSESIAIKHIITPPTKYSNIML